MKRISYIIVLSGVLLASCDNTLEVTAPWKDIPIVHGILSPLDTAHYIRIEKAFLDPEIPATEIARIPDSIYYEELDAALVSVNSAERFQLTEVNATNEGYPRDDGLFAEEPNILYKLRAEDIDLEAGNTYRLEINRSETLPLVTAQFDVVGRPVINVPLPGGLIRFTYDRFFRVLWMVADNAAFYEVNILFNYEESTIDNPGLVESKTLIWSLGKNVENNEVEVLGIDFYEYLADQLVADPGIIREFISIDVEVKSGGPELLEFTRIQQANTGVTSVGGDIPTYTNISEGLGIVTSSNADVNRDYDLHPASLDSLQNGSITGDLNFQ